MQSGGEHVGYGETEARRRVGAMAKLIWRVKLIAELGMGVVSETEVARIERDDFAVPETVGRGQVAHAGQQVHFASMDTLSVSLPSTT